MTCLTYYVLAKETGRKRQRERRGRESQRERERERETYLTS